LHSYASGARNADALFFMLMWERYGFDKNASGHVMPNLCFRILWDLWVTYCILVRPRCETLTHYFSCFGGTGTDSTKNTSGHITPNLCFYIQWDMRVTQCILEHQRREMSTHYFSYLGGNGADVTKSGPGHTNPNLCFLHLVGSTGHVVHSNASVV
jgi:hypothetical protein